MRHTIPVVECARFVTQTYFSIESGQYMSSLFVSATDPTYTGTYECRASYDGRTTRARAVIIVEGTRSLTIQSDTIFT